MERMCDFMQERPGIVRMHGMLRHSLVNGPGVRCVLFLQGCNHHCPGCQNPETHDIQGGTECSIQSILADILTDRNLDGVTLSGGDPLLQPEACIEIAKACMQHGLSVWVYTGYQFEDIYAGKLGEAAQKVLCYTDILVDGLFDAALKSEDCLWRGSTNQRLIDVPASLSRQGKPVLLTI